MKNLNTHVANSTQDSQIRGAVRVASRLATVGLALALFSASPVFASNASYNSTFRAPDCASVGAGCDSGNLLERSGGMFSQERNQPNTGDGCLDGRGNEYHLVDESVERIVVSDVNGRELFEGDRARVDVTFVAYGNGSQNVLELFYTGDGGNLNAPLDPFATFYPTQGGLQTYSTELTLPESSQTRVRVRARLSDLSNRTTCNGNGYYDVDEIVFKIAGFGIQSQLLRTDEDRAAENKSIVACYAELASQAYSVLGDVVSPACTGGLYGAGPLDTRNGMPGDWELSPHQSATYSDIMKFWERTSPNDDRKQVVIALTGSRNPLSVNGAGDWLRDGESQVWFANAPTPNAITDWDNIELSNNEKFAAGFHDRTRNLADDIDQFLDTRVDAWQAAVSGRKVDVKITGHSLGAATSTVVGLYVADRYWINRHATVEVFAFNSPKVANSSMSDTYRRASTNRWFNLHVFNNSHDIVSFVPVGGHHIIETDDDGTDFSQLSTAYIPAYSSDNEASGVHIPGPLNFFFRPVSGTSQAAQYVGERHSPDQWMLPAAGLQTIDVAPDSIASRWFPNSELGGRVHWTPQASDTVDGRFKANLFSYNSGTYLTAYYGGGDSVDAYASAAGPWERFELIPGDNNCVRHGSTVTIKTNDGTHYLQATSGGGLDARATEPSNATVFTVRISPATDGCISNGDFIDLQSHNGGFVSADNPQASTSGAGNSSTITFEVQNVHDVIAIQ